MEIQFWYSEILPNTNIRNVIEKIDTNIPFKNIHIDTVDTTKLNFLVFLLETEWTNSDTPNIAHTHSSEFIELLIKLQSENFYFMCDNSGEAELWVDTLSFNFFNLLKKNKIDFNKLIIINNDASKIGINKTKYGNFILNTCFFPNFFLSTYNHMNDYIEDTTIKKTIKPDKTFLCLNRRMHSDKYKIIEELFNRGILNDTRFTWVRNYVPINQITRKLISELNINVDDFKSIQLEEDVMYGNELSYNDEFLYTINPKWYYKSKVNIITETMLYKNSIHLTEKTWKAIYLGVPFVIYSPSKHYLKTLRDMGFKTFNSVINEDYDEMMDIDKITQVVNSAEELASIYNIPEVLDICNYNQKLYFNVEHRKKVFNDVFLNKLYDVENLTIPKTLI
jgi:hypothetical protein